MTSPPAALPGGQRPRICSAPSYVSTTGDEAIELAALAGINLDPWQQFVLRESLGERADGKWAAFEVGIVCPRQNGKNEILLARELAGLFLLGERLIVHSAHEFGTASEHFRRLIAVIEDTPAFSRRLKRNGIKTANGKEGIELQGGQRFSLKARRKGTGRGFTADCVVLDEAWELTEIAHGAILPTLSTRPNPQVLYAGTAVDQWAHDNGVVLARLRERGINGDDPALAYFEWSLDADLPERVGEEIAADPQAWAQANPALGVRISGEYISNEQRSLDARSFAVERLGVGDWPRTDEAAEQVIDPADWSECIDVDSRAQNPIWIAFDVTPNRDWASIAVAGLRDDELIHVEVIEHRRGTGWLPDRLRELLARHSPAAVICDERGPAASLIGHVEALGVELTTVAGGEYAQACGLFFDACDQHTLRHLDTPELNTAIKGAAQRPLSDAWAWSRKSSAVDISPLVAVTLALWGLSAVAKRSAYQERDLLVLS